MALFLFILLYICHSTVFLEYSLLTCKVNSEQICKIDREKMFCTSPLGNPNGLRQPYHRGGGVRDLELRRSKYVCVCVLRKYQDTQVQR